MSEVLDVTGDGHHQFTLSGPPEGGDVFVISYEVDGAPENTWDFSIEGDALANFQMLKVAFGLKEVVVEELHLIEGFMLFVSLRSQTGWVIAVIFTSGPVAYSATFNTKESAGYFCVNARNSMKTLNLSRRISS